MSSAILQGGPSGTGSVTLLAPNTNSNRTLTLPDITGTILTNLSTGTVLQVVQNTYSTTQQVSNTTALFDSGLTATITPTSVNSKILVLVSQNAQMYIQNNTFQSVNLNICRGSTVVYTYNTCMGMQFAAGNNGYQDMYQTPFMQYLDSPATASPITYKTQGQINNISAQAGLRLQYVGSSVMTLLEIAG